MNKTFRRIFFWALFAVFLISTPIVVFYTQGYRFDNIKMIFIHTGSITVKAVPSNPGISINGQPRPSSNLDIINSSLTIGGLRPGNYNLKVSANSYQDWEKNVDVHSGLSTEFWNIVLVPKDPALTQLASSNVRRFFPSPFGKKIAYVENSPTGFSLYEIDIQKNESRNIFSSDDVRFADDENMNIEWNYKEDTLLCPVARDGKNDYLIVDDSDSPKPQFLSDLTGYSDITHARWSPKEKGVLYFLANNPQTKEYDLFRENMNDSSMDKLLEGVLTYDISSNSIYYLESNNVLYKSNSDGGNISQITLNSFTSDKIGKKTQLIAYDDSRQALITDSGDLFVHNNASVDTIKQIGENVGGTQFSDDGKKLLYWSGGEINVMFLRKWDVQPYRDENEIQSISRFSTPLKNVFWYKDYEHVLFSAGNSIRLIELDPRDHRISNEILENNIDDFPATYDASKGIYYFLHNDNGSNSIQYFSLPVKTGFFG